MYKLILNLQKMINILTKLKEKIMPKGAGTYGKIVGRPPKTKKTKKK